MNELQKALGEGVVLLFIAIMLAPILHTPITFITSQSGVQGISFNLVSETIWTDRLSEIYLHALFLATTIIASVLALRKPPRFAPEELERFGYSHDTIKIDENPNTISKEVA